MTTLAHARRAALALADTAEAPHFDYTSFRVRGKIFATAPPTGTHLHVFVPDELRDEMVALHPGAIEKLWWGKKVIGLKVTLSGVDAALVKRLLAAAWMAKAPKSLHAR